MINITEGEGEGKIQVGISTFYDVVKVYGKKYKSIFHVYSYEIEYSELGISFYYNGTFKEREIECITFKKPCECITSKGIVLGKSLMRDVINVYGEPIWLTSDKGETCWVAYPGINFHVHIDKFTPIFQVDEKRYINELVTKIDVIKMDEFKVYSQFKA